MENNITNKFKGLGVAVITPFTPEGEVDYAALERLVDNLIVNGVDYLLAIGTTSESPTLSDKEKNDIAKTIVAASSKRVPVMLGIGGPCTNTVVQQLHSTDFSGIDAVLSVTPYYNKPSQEGIIEHYKQIAYHSPLPVILYNVVHRTACNIEADTTLLLADECDNIVGIKEASGNMNQIMRLIAHKPDDFLVISGDDAVALPLMAVGIDGLISVVANAFPKQIADMIHFAQQGDFFQARMIHNQLLDITQACFREGNPAGVKAFLSVQNKIDYYLRLPMVRISNALQLHIKDLNDYYLSL